MYKISIIIPVYNTARYLQACIQSLQKQTIGFEHLQVILADDCSTDNSRELMQGYEKQCANIKCIYLEENSGAAGMPRNQAMKLATAPYLMFLDSDDYYYANACEDLYQAMEQTKADIVSGYFSTFDDREGMLEENIFAGRELRKGMYQMPEDLKEIAKFKNGFFSKIYRRDMIEQEKVLFPEKIIGQDSVFLWEYLFHVKKVYYLPVPVVGYRLRKQEDRSVSFTYTRKHFMDILESMRLIYELFAAFGQEKQVGAVYCDINAYYIGQMMDSDLETDELEEVLKSWEWLFIRAQKKQETDLFTKIVMYDVGCKRMREAAETMNLLRELKRYQKEIENARDWWRKQAEGKDIEIDRLKKAAAWWQDQSEKKDLEIKNLRNTEEELRKWVQELEAAREYFLQERKNWIHDENGK